MTVREPAWRVLAQEFLAALEEEKGTGERAASYLLSPLGARMNRVLMVGTLSPPESIGREETQPFWRSKLTDPTGTVTVTAGGFQPRALAALKAWSSPASALVVGKAHLFRGRDGVGYGSLRLEAMRAIDERQYRLALADAVEQTMGRLALLERLRADSAAPVPLSEAPRGWVEAARASLRRYPNLDRGTFERGLGQALSVVAGSPLGSPAVPGPTAPAAGTARVSRSPPAAPRPAPSAQERALESSFLDIVDELSENAVDGYADLKEALERAAGRGLTEVVAEELVNRLEEAGVLEEPVVGKLRRA